MMMQVAFKICEQEASGALHRDEPEFSPLQTYHASCASTSPPPQHWQAEASRSVKMFEGGRAPLWGTGLRSLGSGVVRMLRLHWGWRHHSFLAGSPPPLHQSTLIASPSRLLYVRCLAVCAPAYSQVPGVGGGSRVAAVRAVPLPKLVGSEGQGLLDFPVPVRGERGGASGRIPSGSAQEASSCTHVGFFALDATNLRATWEHSISDHACVVRVCSVDCPVSGVVIPVCFAPDIFYGLHAWC